MAEFDVVIRDGMIVDGTRMPRFHGDIGIKDGRDREDRAACARPTARKRSTLRE